MKYLVPSLPKTLSPLSSCSLFIGNSNLDGVTCVPKPQISEASAVTRLLTLEIGGKEIEIGGEPRPTPKRPEITLFCLSGKM